MHLGDSAFFRSTGGAAPMSGATLVAASGLTRAFGNQVAVEGLSLEIGAGQIFALLGPNGAGKTTTLRMLAGLIAPDAGEIRIAGLPLTTTTAGRLHARIGLLTEAPGHWDRLTVGQNLTIHVRLHGLPQPAAVAERMLRQFDLWSRRNDPAAVLSKGMKQKLALARALAHDPEVVLLDEPTAGLDPQTARSLRDTVLGLRARGRAILVSTHNLDEAERLADRVAVLQRRLVAVDTPAALRARLFGRRVRIVLTADAAPFAETVRRAGGGDVAVRGDTLSVAVPDAEIRTPALVRALVEAGADLRAVFDEEPPLEEVYLRLMAQDR